jgi:hypothetical protein
MNADKKPKNYQNAVHLFLLLIVSLFICSLMLFAYLP